MKISFKKNWEITKAIHWGQTGFKPRFYGVLYFLLIFVYTVFYLYIPGLIGFYESEGQIISLNFWESFTQSFYFSVITITTLGYGDISPNSWYGQLATASEALFGIMLIGLFLNALSHQHAKTIEDNERVKQSDEKRKKDIATLNRVHKLLSSYITEYINCTDRLYEFDYDADETQQEQIQRLIKAERHSMTRLFDPGAFISVMEDPHIVSYYQSLDKLQSALENYLVASRFKEWEKLEKTLHEIVISARRQYLKEYILTAVEEKGIRPEIIDVVTDNTSKYDETKNLITFFRLQAIDSLHHQITHTLQLIQNYLLQLDTINKSQPKAK